MSNKGSSIFAAFFAVLILVALGWFVVKNLKESSLTHVLDNLKPKQSESLQHFSPAKPVTVWESRFKSLNNNGIIFGTGKIAKGTHNSIPFISIEVKIQNKIKNSKCFNLSSSDFTLQDENDNDLATPIDDAQDDYLSNKNVILCNDNELRGFLYFDQLPRQLDRAVLKYTPQIETQNAIKVPVNLTLPVVF